MIEIVSLILGRSLRYDRVRMPKGRVANLKGEVLADVQYTLDQRYEVTSDSYGPNTASLVSYALKFRAVLGELPVREKLTLLTADHKKIDFYALTMTPLCVQPSGGLYE